MHRPSPLAARKVRRKRRSPASRVSVLLLLATPAIAATACVGTRASAEALAEDDTWFPERSPSLDPNLSIGASFAGRNNPNGASGEEDNIAGVVAGRLALPLGDFAVSLRPELQLGEHALQATPALTFEFPLVGSGLGSVDGHVGLGWSILDDPENHVLGNTSSLFARIGVETPLAGHLVAGAALLVAPHGYDREDTALAGVMTAGVRF